MKIRISLLFMLVLSVIPVGLVHAQPKNKPKLVILISVDQMSPDYFDRFSSLMNGGLRTMYDKGIVYRNCQLDYAYTETGPGHATMATGCFPQKHGIFLNSWHDRQSRKSIYCVRDSSARPIEGMGGYSSPLNEKQTTVGDWLKDEFPLSRVVSLSLKDRAAILMGGHRADIACWYSSSSGKFVSSSYYGNALPEFVRQFNEINFLDSVPGQWDKLQSGCDNMTSPDSMEGESTRLGNTTKFPHAIGPDTREHLLPFTPFGDSLLLELALRGVNQLHLGHEGDPDFLCIGLSCTDYIGHSFGPNSVEMCDQIKRLDRYLGTFLEAVQKYMGDGGYAVVLTADHSVLTLPEYSSAYLGKQIHRMIEDGDMKDAIQRCDSIMRQRLYVRKQLVDPKGFLDYAGAAEAGVRPDELEKQVGALLKENGFVKDVFFRRDLLGAGTQNRPHLKEFRRSYDAINGPDFMIDVKDEYLITEKGYPAHHSLFCTHVPLIVYSGGLKGMKIERKVQSVDIAPTIARLLGISAPSTIDGKALKEIGKGIGAN